MSSGPVTPQYNWSHTSVISQYLALEDAGVQFEDGLGHHLDDQGLLYDRPDPDQGGQDGAVHVAGATPHCALVRLAVPLCGGEGEEMEGGVGEARQQAGGGGHRAPVLPHLTQYCVVQLARSEIRDKFNIHGNVGEETLFAALVIG